MARKVKKKIKTKPEANNASATYTAKDIYVLEGLEPVRKRPGMYIGSTGVDGLHHLVKEVVDNASDEAISGFAKNIAVTLLPQNRVMVVDDGRGIPVEKHTQTKKSALETVMTTLHAGAKFGGESYKVAAGLHGVGVSVVCALSTWMRVEVCRDSFQYAQEYSRGKPRTPVKKIGRCGGSGTAVSFEPDPEVFEETTTFDWSRILEWLRQQAYLTRGVTYMLRDERSAAKAKDGSPLIPTYSFYFDGGIVSYVKYLNRGETPKHENIFYVSKEMPVNGGRKIWVESAFQYTDDIQSHELSFANHVHTPDGGMHLTGFRAALTRALNDYAKKNEYFKKDDEALTGEDVREGLTAVISVKLAEAQFEGQTKAKLGNPEARTAVESVVAEAVQEFLEKHPDDAQAIIATALLAQKARKAAKAAKETVLRKGALEGMTLPGKLADCQSRNPEESELFLVEGDSAGGSAKSGRDRKFQAILPLKGKILNVERARLDKMLAFKEIRALIIALGAAIGDEFDEKKLRYHRIIIATDADSVTGDTPMLLLDAKENKLVLRRVDEFIQGGEDTERYRVFSFGESSLRTGWRKIYETIQHPLRSDLLEVTTACGYRVRITPFHSCYLRDGQGVKAQKGSRLRVGDRMALVRALPRTDQEIIIHLDETMLANTYRNLSIRVPLRTLEAIPAAVWFDFSPDARVFLKGARMVRAISRRRMEKLVGVGRGVVQQWEERFDNVLPAGPPFLEYLMHLGVDVRSLDPQVFVPIEAWPFRTIPDSAEVYAGNHSNRVWHRLALDTELAYLLGWYLGDGSSGNYGKNPHRFCLSLGRDLSVCAPRLIEMINARLGSHAFIDHRASGGTLTFHSPTWKFFLEHLGLYRKRAHEKFVPDLIFNATRSVQEAFLAGLLESDGHVLVIRAGNHPKVLFGHTTVSRALAEGIVTLYRQLGVFPSVNRSRNMPHRYRGVLIRSNHERWTVEISTVTQIEAQSGVWGNHRKAGELRRYLRSVDHSSLRGKPIEPISDSLVAIPIRHIRRIPKEEAGEQWVYDFSILGDQNFVAGLGGFALHNTDGAHIRTLLLTLFFRYFPKVIELGYLYIATPPLYRLQKGKEIRYAYSDPEKEKVITELQKSEPKGKIARLLDRKKPEVIAEPAAGAEPETEASAEGGEKTRGVSIQRYKGLGEMNPIQLWETTMDPARRILKQVMVADAVEADRIFDILMGDEVMPRKKFIQTYAKAVKNLDI